jgi:hypothetical protein
MSTVREFLAQLPASAQVALGNHLRAALLSTRRAGGTFTQPGPMSGPVSDLLVSLEAAIHELEAARAIVMAHST